MPSQRSFVVILLLFLAAGLMSFAYTPARGQEPPNPIDPSSGEQSLLDVVNSLPINDIQNALDNFPVPYVVVASANGATPTIKNNKAKVPTNIDADVAKATGKGGHDIKVEVNTVLLPTPRLELTVDRLGTAPFAQDLFVLIAFPFDAFNGEDGTLPGDPNLFIGYETSLAGGAPGGIAPLQEKFIFTPDILTGSDHIFSMTMETTGGSNPLRFIAGHFDGTTATGLLNVSAISALAEPQPPSSITVGLDLAESPIAIPGDTDTSFGLSWDASSPAKVTFDYLEEENGVPSFANPTDYNTTVTFDQMPAGEDLTLTLDEDNKALTLSHRGSAVINAITVLHERADGLSITGSLTDVPTEVDLTVNTDGAVTLDVNANTLDLRLLATQTDDFFGSTGFFAFGVGYIEAFMTNAPDLTASYVNEDDRFRVQATKLGESIGSVGIVLDDGPTPVIGGGLDMDHDGDVDGTDDGNLHGIVVIDGGVDADGDGDVDGDDDGTFEASVPSDAAIINGQIDLNADVSVDANDKGDLTVLKLAPSWEEIPIHHIFSLADDGTQGTAAARLVNVSEGSFDLDAAGVFDGMLDINNDGVVDGNDDGIIAVVVDVIDGNIDVDDDGFITGADDDRMFGHEIIDGKMDLDDDDDVDGNDDGQLNGHTYRIGTTAAAPLQGGLFTKPGTTLIPPPFQDVDAICDVDDIPAGTINFQIGFPPPDVSISYKIDPPQGIDQINCAGHVGTVGFELLISDLPPEFEFDFKADAHLTVRAEDGSGTPNSDNVGALIVRLCDEVLSTPAICVAGENGAGLPDTSGLIGEPLRDARARADDIPSMQGRWGDASSAVIDGRLDINGDAVVDGNDDRINFTGFRVIDGRVDIDGSGAVDGNDDGRITGKPVINGDVDFDIDGDVDANDDGTISGSGMKFDTGVPDASLFMDGMQFDVSTEVGLAPLAAADPSSDHFVAFTDEGGSDEKRIRGGAFGIDEFAYSSDDNGRGLAVNYAANQDHRLLLDFDSAFGGRFFPQFAIDLNLTIDDVPRTWSFFTDMATKLVYDGSSNIDSITIDGTIDNTNDADDTNGTVVEFDFDPIPAHVAFHLAPDPKPVIAGRLDVKAPAGIDGADDDIYAGVRIIDGEVDIDGSGAVDGSDNGILVGVAVMTGRLDTNRDGSVNGDDNASLAGAMLRMSEPVPEISFSLTSSNNILGIPLQLIEFSILNIPARWDINWGGGRFLVEARDTSDNPAPMGSINAQVSTSSDQATIDAKVEPFTLDGDQLGGPVLGAAGASGGCRVNYSEFLQEIDRRYYNAAPDVDPSTVFPRLSNLYCDSKQFDPGEDHVLVRLGGPALIDYGSLQLSGFQHVSWTPDANGGQFILRVPTPGLHPLFLGAETGGLFATLEIGNIPDQVIVDVDMTEHITYDATDDVDGSILYIDAYVGPLPTADDDDFAARFVLDFPGPVVNTTDFVHIGWNLAFPDGGAFFNASEPFDILFLIQDGSNRATAGLEMEDLHAAWGLDLGSFDVVEEQEILPYPCFTPEPDICYLSIPVEWELVAFEAGVDNDADAESLSLPIVENPAKTAIDGFVAVYEMRGGIEDLTPAAGVGHATQEYLPFVTIEGKGFGIGSIKAQLTLDPLSPNLFCLAPLACVSLHVPIDISGDVTLDIWSNVLTNETFGGNEIIPEIGFRNRPDYRENDPFHIVPFNGLDDVKLSLEPGTLVINFDGFHDFDEHLDPFAP